MKINVIVKWTKPDYPRDYSDLEQFTLEILPDENIEKRAIEIAQLRLLHAGWDKTHSFKYQVFTEVIGENKK